MFGSCLSAHGVYLPQASVSTKTIHKNIAVGLCPRKIILDVGACVAELFADLLVFCATFQTNGVFI